MRGRKDEDLAVQENRRSAGPTSGGGAGLLLELVVHLRVGRDEQRVEVHGAPPFFELAPVPSCLGAPLRAPLLTLYRRFFSRNRVFDPGAKYRGLDPPAQFAD